MIGIVIVGIAIVYFVTYCLMDAVQKADDNEERFARFENRSPGMTDVDK